MSAVSRTYKTIQLDGQQIVVNELTVKDLVDLFSYSGNVKLETFPSIIRDVLPRFTNLTYEDLLDLAPSQLPDFIQAIKEVNVDFSEMFKLLGLNELLQALKAGIVKDLNILSAGLLNEAIRGSGSTDLGSS